MSQFLPTYKAVDFSYTRADKVMTAEASTLGYNLCVPQIEIQGRDHLLTFDRFCTDYDRSGEDFAGWWYRLTKADAMKHPYIAHLRVLIIND